jgi:DNA polymerase I
MTINAEIHFVDSIAEINQLYEWISKPRPFIAVDTESEGLHWWEHRPRLLQFGDSNTAWVIPWHLYGGVILEILRDFQGELVMHNMPFDVMMFEHWSGVKLPRHRMHDTRVLAHLLEPHLPTGLKPVSERHVDRTAARSQRILYEAMKLHKWTWATVPLDFQPYWVYAGMDVILTSRAYEKLHPLVVTECPRAYELEMAVSWVLIDMMYRGVAVDKGYTEQKLADFRRYVDQSSAWCRQEYGVDAGSDVNVVKRLQRDIPESAYAFTKLTAKTKRPSLDRDVLLEVIAATQHPLAEVVLQRRRIQGICTKYLSKFLLYSEMDGRIHPSFNPVARGGDDSESEEGGYGARTGRMSLSEPPLQQLPRKDNTNPVAEVVRRCIVAAEGNLLVMSDWDQLEFRVYAHLCQDPGLLEAFRLPGDFFVNMARVIFGDPTLERDDPRRQPTKNGGYSKIFGSGIDKFAATVGTTSDVARAFMWQMDATYPGMNAFNSRIERIARDREESEGIAYVRCPLTGRKHTCVDGRYYALVNYVVQGLAAVVLKMKNVELHARGLGDYLVLDVHDEMILDAPREVESEVRYELHQIMEDRELFSVALTATAKSAETWGGK